MPEQQKNLENRTEPNLGNLFRGIGRFSLDTLKNEFHFKKHPITTTLKTLFFGAIGYSLIFMLPQEAKRRVYDEGLTQKVSVIADKLGNNDGATTSSEWAEVYKELGVRYDAHNYNPLTTEQKEKYISDHK